jgi:hypothetical protein
MYVLGFILEFEEWGRAFCEGRKWRKKWKKKLFTNKYL